MLIKNITKISYHLFLIFNTAHLLYKKFIKTHIFLKTKLYAIRFLVMFGKRSENYVEKATIN